MNTSTIDIVCDAIKLGEDPERALYDQHQAAGDLWFTYDMARADAAEAKLWLGALCAA